MVECDNCFDPKPMRRVWPGLLNNKDRFCSLYQCDVCKHVMVSCEMPRLASKAIKAKTGIKRAGENDG